VLSRSNRTVFDKPKHPSSSTGVCDGHTLLLTRFIGNSCGVDPTPLLCFGRAQAEYMFLLIRQVPVSPSNIPRRVSSVVRLYSWSKDNGCTRLHTLRYYSHPSGGYVYTVGWRVAGTTVSMYFYQENWHDMTRERATTQSTGATSKSTFGTVTVGGPFHTFSL
jgi:hypothetical protein